LTKSSKASKKTKTKDKTPNPKRNKLVKKQRRTDKRNSLNQPVQ
jgi:hypothetical protein